MDKNKVPFFFFLGQIRVYHKEQNLILFKIC